MNLLQLDPMEKKLHPGLAMRYYRYIFQFVLCVFLVCLVLAGASRPGHASLEEDVARKNQELAKQKKQIQALTDKERALHKDLAQLEKTLAQSAALLQQLEKDLDAAKKTQADILMRLSAVRAQQNKAADKLAEHMRTLWPIYLTARNEGFSSAQEWAEANRQAVWLAALYREAELVCAEFAQQSAQVEIEQAAQDAARAAIDAQLQKISVSQADVLKKQANFTAQLKKVRAERTKTEKNLNDLAASIAALRHKIALQATQKISTQQGRLPWPATGKILTSFGAPGAEPNTGIGMALPDNTPVRCMAAGNVVHNDQLRGFGRVVIVFHGEDYYSLYAFLADAPLPVGSAVKQGEHLGTSGFYPKAKGSGLYFELRFRQKAINPLKWLQSR
ncbi:peptidoglycan DD-metalloendopeptidase family protein [Desulfovibrionales bacterium]